MNEKNIICNYCKKHPPDKVDEYPTWFGWYRADELLAVICKDCLPKNREKWRKREF